MSPETGNKFGTDDAVIVVLAFCLHVYCSKFSIFILCEDFLCNSVLKNADYAVFAKLSIQCGTYTTKFSMVKPTFEKEN